MKKGIFYLLLLMTCVACGGGGGGEDAPEITKDYLSVTPSLELLAEGQTADITINSNCNWTISKDADWLTVTPMSGSNTQTVTIAAIKNSSGADRMAILTVQGGSLPARRVTVTQKKVPETPIQYTMSVNTTSLNYEKNGGSQNFVISSNTNWTISCPEWCTLSTKTGSGNATITVTVGKNEKAEQRKGEIVLNGEGVDFINISITQEAGDKNTDEPNPNDNLPPS